MEINKEYGFSEFVYQMSTDEFDKVDLVDVAVKYSPFNKYPVVVRGEMHLFNTHDFETRLDTLKSTMSKLDEECLAKHGEGRLIALDHYTFKIVAISEDRDI